MELYYPIWSNHASSLYEYSRRQPEESALYRLVFNYREEFEYRYGELFEERYGFLRSNVLESFDAYLNCGILRHGCARAHCEECNHSELIAFSCKERVLCPSCTAKRGHIFAQTLHETILLPRPHKHLVFTVPKRIRPYFKYDRKLFKIFYKSAWDAWKWYVEGNLPEGTSGAVMSLHTAGDLLNFHPHVHSLVLPGVITPSGEYQELPEIDTELLAELFQEKVLNAFLERGLLSQDDVNLMKSWEHSGFNVWVGDDILPESEEERLFVSRYLVKCPLSLERLEILDDERVRYSAKDSREGEVPETKSFSPLEFLAELSQHIPDTYEQVIRYYGYYSARTRGARRREEELEKLAKQTKDESSQAQIDRDIDKKPVCKSWAGLIKKVYEIDPLQCPKCGGSMKIKAFIHDPEEISRICENLGLPDWRAPPKMGKDRKFQVPDLDEFSF